MENTINERLGYICPGRTKNSIEMAGLFDEWYHRTAQLNKDKTDGDETHIGHYGLVCDGIMRKRTIDDVALEQEWWDSKMRIAFLMKDQNQKGYIWTDDARNWLIQKDEAWELKDKTFHYIANILWGLTHITPDNHCFPTELNAKYYEIRYCFQHVPFAYIECKKQGGGPQLDGKNLKPYLIDYKDLLYKELDILMPNIFVCTNDKIYEFVQEYITKYKYPNTELTRVHPEKHNSIRLHLPSKTIILLGYHPTARESPETIYEGVMDHYRAFVQSEYYPHFFEK